MGKAPGTTPLSIIGQEGIDKLRACGYEIVPKEPTPEMLAAGYGFCGEENGSDKPASDFYRAMIAAAK